jgi:hypothetical protein
MGSPAVSYSDLPLGAKIVHDPSGQYSDLPEGATVVPAARPSPAAHPSILKQAQSAYDTAATPEPINARPGIGGAATTALSNLGSGLIQTAAPLVHPVETAKAALSPIPAGRAVLGNVPIPAPETNSISSFAAKATDALQHPKDTLMKAGGYLEALPGLAIGLKGASEIPGAAADTKSYLRPTPSESVVPAPEMASRRLAQAVLPRGKDAASFIKAAPEEVPNILAHAKETGNPLNTQLEFSKAAQGHAQNVRDFYENQILKPNDREVSVPANYGGEKANREGNSARLSDIDRRVVQINKELSGAYKKGSADDVRSSLASKADLESERDKLTGILHNELAKSTGLDPLDIAGIRQRVGRAYELGNDVESAVIGRMQGEGKADQGPFHLSQIPAKAIETIRGGPTAIADRAFQRSIRNFPGEPQPLPALRPSPFAPPSRTPVWAGIEGSSRPTLEPVTPDTEGAKAAMQEKLQPRKIAVEMGKAEKNNRAEAAKRQMELNRSTAGKRLTKTPGP